MLCLSGIAPDDYPIYLSVANLTNSSNSHKQHMENPHQEQQNAIMSRVISNVEKLNEAVMELNRSLQVCPLNHSRAHHNRQST